MNTKCPKCNKNTSKVEYLDSLVKEVEFSMTNAFRCKECKILILFSLEGNLKGLYNKDYFIDDTGNVFNRKFYFYNFTSKNYKDKIDIYSVSAILFLNYKLEQDLICELNNIYVNSNDLLNALEKVLNNTFFI